MTPAEFWSLVDKSDADGCWHWRGRVNSNGRGRLSFDGRRQYAYRVAWELTNDRRIPDGMYACHSCDNPLCVRPAHIFLGTQFDNMRDAVAKGRFKKSRGKPGVPRPMVTDEQVYEARRMHASGDFTMRQIARSLGVDPRSVSRWVRGETRVKVRSP